jgi:hypothetical protein
MTPHVQQRVLNFFHIDEQPGVIGARLAMADEVANLRHMNLQAAERELRVVEENNRVRADVYANLEIAKKLYSREPKGHIVLIDPKSIKEKRDKTSHKMTCLSASPGGVSRHEVRTWRDMSTYSLDKRAKLSIRIAKVEELRLDPHVLDAIVDRKLDKAAIIESFNSFLAAVPSEIELKLSEPTINALDNGEERWSFTLTGNAMSTDMRAGFVDNRLGFAIIVQMTFKPPKTNGGVIDMRAEAIVTAVGPEPHFSGTRYDGAAYITQYFATSASLSRSDVDKDFVLHTSAKASPAVKHLTSSIDLYGAASRWMGMPLAVQVGDLELVGDDPTDMSAILNSIGDTVIRLPQTDKNVVRVGADGIPMRTKEEFGVKLFDSIMADIARYAFEVEDVTQGHANLCEAFLRQMQSGFPMTYPTVDIVAADEETGTSNLLRILSALLYMPPAFRGSMGTGYHSLDMSRTAEISTPFACLVYVPPVTTYDGKSVFVCNYSAALSSWAKARIINMSELKSKWKDLTGTDLFPARDDDAPRPYTSSAMGSKARSPGNEIKYILSRVAPVYHRNLPPYSRIMTTVPFLAVSGESPFATEPLFYSARFGRTISLRPIVDEVIQYDTLIHSGTAGRTIVSDPDRVYVVRTPYGVLFIAITKILRTTYAIALLSLSSASSTITSRRRVLGLDVGNREHGAGLTVRYQNGQSVIFLDALNVDAVARERVM